MKANGGSVSQYFADMRRMSNLLSDFYTPLETQEWLLAKQPMLGDQSPAQMIAQGRTAEVEQLIDNLRSGAFL
jgi:uncharacterized protein (DUF2384 family)